MRLWEWHRTERQIASRRGRIVLLGGVLMLAAGCTSAGSKAGTPSPSSTAASPPAASAPASPGASGIGGVASGDIVAVVGGKPITRAQLEDRLLAAYGADTLREMMVREAVRLEADRLGEKVTEAELEREIQRMSEGYESESDFYAAMRDQLGMDRAAVREEAAANLLLEKLATRDVQVTDAELSRYYEEHRQEYGERAQYRLSWILVSTELEAQQVLDRLEQGGDFAELAGRFSLDEFTADAGGDLGWVDSNDTYLDRRILSTASRLQVGEAAGPVQVDDGYAVVLLGDEQAIPGKSLASVREEIRRQLAIEQAPPMHELEESLLRHYGAEVRDSRLKP